MATDVFYSQKCQLNFRLFEKERFVDDNEEVEVVGNQPTSNTIPINDGEDVRDYSSRFQRSTKAMSKRRRDVDDEFYFNRVHYHYEILKKRLVRAPGSDSIQKSNILQIKSLPALHKAAATGDLSQINTPLDRGEDINVPLPFRAILKEEIRFQFEGCSPLQIAVFFGKSKAVDALLERGADINAQDADNGAVLMYAISGENRGLVMKLLTNGANTRNRDKYGAYVLHHAVRYGDMLLYSLLVEFGADPKEIAENGSAPIHEAAFYGNEAVVKALLEQDNTLTSMRRKDGRTPLHRAAMKLSINEANHVRLVLALIENGSDVNATDEHGLSPLHEAAVRDILRRSLSCFNKNSDGSTR